MLGTGKEVIKNYVETGEVKLVFWPVLNHGNPSVYSTLTAECVGQQDPNTFWVAHELLFSNQRELWQADRDYFVNTAVSVGADKVTFEACYDGSQGLETITALDSLRRERGVYSQPVFDIAGELYAGSPPFEAFALILDDALNP